MICYSFLKKTSSTSGVPVTMASPSMRSSGAGDEPAAWNWSALDTELRPRLVRGAVLRFGIRRELAEELVQDVFEQVWARRPRVRNPEAYLRTSFYHRCADVLRTDRSRIESEMRPLDESLSDGAAAERILNVCAVRGAFRRLSPSCRGLVRAYIIDGESLADVAARVETNVNTVWKRIDRCVKWLVRWLT